VRVELNTITLTLNHIKICQLFQEFHLKNLIIVITCFVISFAGMGFKEIFEYWRHWISRKSFLLRSGCQRNFYMYIRFFLNNTGVVLVVIAWNYNYLCNQCLSSKVVSLNPAHGETCFVISFAGMGFKEIFEYWRHWISRKSFLLRSGCQS
jgi:hypothetical protein